MGGAVRPGSYAFLTNATDLTSGATTFTAVSGAEALLLNKHGYADHDYAEVLATVKVGDRITWRLSTTCWYHYRVTAILADPLVPARKMFGIMLVTEDPCGSTVTQRNDPNTFNTVRDYVVGFTWNKPPDEPEIGSDGIRILPAGYAVEGGHTYRLTSVGGPTSTVIDVPEGMRLKEAGDGMWTSNGSLYVTYLDEVSSVYLGLYPHSGEGADYFVLEGSRSDLPTEVIARFEALITSIRELETP